MRIGINCGHSLSGQPGSGAVGLINESDETRVVGELLSVLLTKMGHTVINCTNDYANTTNENLKRICKLANDQPLDIFVSLHFNAGAGKGTEVYTYKKTEHKEALAICENMKKLGFINRGVKDGSKLYVIKNTNAKALLVEICFVDSANDVGLYKTKLNEIVEALAKAITNTAYVSSDVKPFIDIDKSDYAYEDLKRLKEYGIINGYPGGEFRPNNNITRREMAVMISRALKICGK